MTINVALVTNEFVVLGCDSVASVTKNFIDPVRYAVRNTDGTFQVDVDGNFVAKFAATDMQEVVTDAWGGVTKIFPICPIKDRPIAAVTAGLAQLSNQTISSLAYDFMNQPHKPKATVFETVTAYTDFMSAKYESYWTEQGMPPALRSDIEFLIGGFGPGDNFPSLYRVNLAKPEGDRVAPVYGEGAAFTGLTGLAWSGQSDAVQRLIYGYDQPLRFDIHHQVRALVEKLHQDMSAAALRILGDTLAAVGQELPDAVDTSLPAMPTLDLAWDDFLLNINYASLPLQSAVELVSYLVNLQSGKAKFVRGVPTVGGRTHIGLIRKSAFALLNEPKLTHRNTGYDRDL